MSGTLKRLRRARDERGYSRQRLARMADVSEAVIEKAESRGSDPATSIALKLARALETTVEELSCDDA